MVKARQFILVIGDLIIAAVALVLTVAFGFWGKFTTAILIQHVIPFALL